MNCISCKNSFFTKYSDESYLHLPVFCCNSCGLLITGNSEEDVKKVLINFYKGKYWKKGEIETYINSDYTDPDSFSKRRQWISQYKYCTKYIKGKNSLLEVGVGGGQSIYWFEERGFKVIGIEPDPKNVEFINKKLRNGSCIVGFAEEVEIEKKFDIIWMSHVLEHLIRPDLFLQKIQKNLNDNGIFFIEVPNSENKKLLKKLIPSVPHTFHFTKKSLMNIVVNAGYEVEACDYFRPPTLIEGAINRIFTKYLRFLQINIFPYYPRIKTTNTKGRDLRIILTKREMLD